MTDLRTSFVEAEIARQPSSWRRAIELAPQVGTLLPRPGERVAVIGCGTSWFVAQAYATLREQQGLGETDAFTASHFPTGRAYDRVVAISRSGTTTEVAAALQRSTAPAVALTALDDSPVSRAAQSTVLLDFADEQSVVQTVFASTVLMLLRASVGESLEQAVAQAEDVLAADGVTAAEDCAQFTFLGQGWAYGIAQEAALKMREAAQLWTEAYVQMEYRHGPIAIAEPGRAVWVFGRPVDGLRADITATGATLVDDDLDPVADLVRAQLLAVRRARAADLDADRPRSLTRSVVLPG